MVAVHFAKFARSPAPFLLIFAVSGFAGLIYESIWTQYLKLLLGHAAFSQSLVLCIFMGGMALGAWLCSRYSTRWPNLLRGYALAECCVGVIAFSFHPIFVQFLDLSYDTVLPALSSPLLIASWQWTASGVLLLPQAILLGMTFPLMTAGLIRRFPENSGSTISLLYFTNSLGAAVGVLASGFFFIGQFGLPGTLAVAGVLNLLLALVVWKLAPEHSKHEQRQAVSASTRRSNQYPILLTIALATGAASFIYEISWIRLLNLVLGSSTHAFELMLSAFVMGIAFGGLWIRGRIDSLRSPLLFLAGVQVLMGVLAVATLPVYTRSFELMSWLVTNLPKTDAGYLAFNLASHGIALSVMLPATFCAGMTLPLITHILLQAGNGERSIGAVYAWNTLGAIAGVLLATHVGMVLLGVKGLLVFGAFIDITLGIMLITYVGRRSLAFAAALTAVVLVSGIIIFVPLEPHRMASAVYRLGELDVGEDEVLFQQDGKTATVSVTKNADELVMIRTNGKPDAGIVMASGPQVSPDEYTMVLLGALPMALHPQASTVANIGMGSGLTSHTLLQSARLERVDTIEIEPVMYEGARLFGDRVASTYQDPRSRIYFDDAKSFFSSRNESYDIIISEPSNPWVSGISTLFSQDFYHRIRNHLNEGGLFVQWIQIYEMNEAIVISILKALDLEFADYHIYLADNDDLIIVASNHIMKTHIDKSVFSIPGLSELLDRIYVREPADLEARWYANKVAIGPFIRQYPIEANTDYYPIVDLLAVRSRFMRDSARSMFLQKRELLPIMELMSRRAIPEYKSTEVTYSILFPYSRVIAFAPMVLDYMLGKEWIWVYQDLMIPESLRRQSEVARHAVMECQLPINKESWYYGMYNILVHRVIPHVSSIELIPLWQRLQSDACWSQLEADQQNFILLWQALGNRDAPAMIRYGEKILYSQYPLAPVLKHYVAGVAALGYLTQDEVEKAEEIWAGFSTPIAESGKNSFENRVLLSFMHQR